MGWTTPRTWVAGQPLTAAQLNEQLRDNLNALAPLALAWQPFSPTVNGIVKGNGSLQAAYVLTGKTVSARFLFQAGSTSSYTSGNFSVSLPVTPSSFYSGGNIAVGSAVAKPGSSRFGATAVIVPDGTLNFFLSSPTASSSVDSATPTAWGTASSLSFTVTYEAA